MENRDLDPDPSPWRPAAVGSAQDFLHKATVAVGVGLFAILLASLIVLTLKVLLAIFAGLLLATFLLALRDPLARRTRLSPGWALALVIVLLIALAVAATVLLVPHLAEQAGEFGERLPRLISQSQAYLQQSGWGRQLLQTIRAGEGMKGVQEGIGPFFSATVETFGLLITFLAVGLFIAGNPALYAEGIVRLLPLPWRERAHEVLGEIGHTLRLFLVARAIAMTLVGASTAIALLLLDIPLALLLGVVAGILTFAPYLGPIIAGVPIVIVALLESPEMALYAIVLYAIIQNVEGVLFDPLILQRVIRLAPVVTLGSQMMAGVLLGPAGIALATPFAAVLQVLVRRVWREDLLGEPKEPVGGEKIKRGARAA